MILILFLGFGKICLAQDLGEVNEVASTITQIKKSVVSLGTLEGNVNYLLFLKIKGVNEQSAKDIIEELKKNEYLDEQGNILYKFSPYEKNFRLKLNEKFISFEKEIIEILKQNLKAVYLATGFLVNFENIFYLVTAKHVVTLDLVKTQNMVVFFNSKNGQIKFRPLKEIRNLSFNWIFHNDPRVDIAMMPFMIDLQDDDLKAIPDGWFYPTKNLNELLDVFFMSYQPGIADQKKISPIVRSGMISIINEDKTFYIDGFVFPGNSGSPVILRFAPLAIDEKGIPYFINLKSALGFKLVGIIGECVTSQEVAVSIQTKRPRMLFEENTGLSKVWSIDYVNQIVNSDNFQKQHKKIKEGFLRKTL